MVIEGIVTTENEDGSMHVAPIGPHVNSELTSWVLKPFQSSTTFTNLKRSSRAVFHVVDDPLLMAAAVLGYCNRSSQDDEVLQNFGAQPFGELVASHFVSDVGWVLELSCRWFGLTIVNWDTNNPRAVAECKLSKQEQIRSFWGWNRARHSILELAILASRIHMLDRAEIDQELARHKIIIEKTAGDRERHAWELLRKHLSP